MKKIIITLLLAIYVSSIIFLAIEVFCMQLKQTENKENGIVFDADAQEIKQNNISNINIPCWDKLIFESGTTEQTVNFYNPQSNSGVNIKVNLYVDDVLVYESNLIKPGMAIKKIKLKNTMQKQISKAYINYECYRNNGTKLNGAKMNFVLEVI